MQPGTPSYVIDKLNHPATGSRFVTVADLDHGVHAGENLPAVASGVALVNGSEKDPTVADFLGAPGDGTGLRALDTVQPQLLAVPDAHQLGADAARTVAQGAIAYCAGRGDCMYVGAPPDRKDETVSRYVDSVKKYAAGGLQGRKVYGALYAPWIIVPDVAASGPNPVRADSRRTGTSSASTPGQSSSEASSRRPPATPPPSSAQTASVRTSATASTPTSSRTVTSTASGRFRAAASWWRLRGPCPPTRAGCS